jgi:hypothetical protein
VTAPQSIGAGRKALEGKIGPGLIGHDLAAQYLDVPPSTLHGWNHRGIGPRSCRLGKHRKYLLSDLDAFIEARMTGAA